MENKLVTIIIPTYNRIEFLEQTLQSVQSQTYPSIEILLIDDGSTVTDIEQFIQSRSFPSKTILIKKDHTGLSDTLNQGIFKAEGDYLVFLDDDDFLASDMVEKCIKAAVDYSADMVIVGYQYFKDNKVIKESNLPIYQKENEELLKDLSHHNLWPINSILIRKDAVIKAGGFNKALSTNMDWDLWIRVMLNHPKVHFIHEHLAFVRIHKTNMSQDLIKMCEGCVLVLENLEKSLSIQKKREFKIDMEIARKILILGALELLFNQSRQNARELFIRGAKKHILYILPSTMFLMISLLPLFILNKIAQILKFYINKKCPYPVNV